VRAVRRVRAVRAGAARALSPGFEAAQARALGFEQARDADDGRVVVEEREQLDCPRERAQQRLGRAGRRRCLAGQLRSVREFADFGERVDEFCARALKVREQARDVAAVDAAPGGQKVVARAPGDAAQLHLARRGRVVAARAGAGQRESRVALDALASGEQSLPPRFADVAALGERVFEGEERVDGRAPRAFDLPLVGGV